MKCNIDSGTNEEWGRIKTSTLHGKTNISGRRCAGDKRRQIKGDKQGPDVGMAKPKLWNAWKRIIFVVYREGPRERITIKFK